MSASEQGNNSQTGETKPPRWPLWRLLQRNPSLQLDLTIVVGLWAAGLIIAVFSAVLRVPSLWVPPALIAAADVVGLAVLLGMWKQMNPGLLVLFHTVAISILLPAEWLIPEAAIASIPVMFAASEAAQRWWYSALEETAGGSVTRTDLGSRSVIEVGLLSAGAALVVILVGLFDSRAATIGALGVFALIALAAWAFGRPDRTAP